MIASFCSRRGIALERNIPLCDRTTFRIGGPADYGVFPKTVEELSDLIRFFHDNSLRYFVLGRGSDLLVSDAGYRGIILFTSELKNLRREGDLIVAGAGCSLASVSNFAQREGLGGIEFLHGIPGSVGGGIFMNAGAYGGEIGTYIQSVQWVDPEGKIHTSPIEALEFSYRHSSFCSNFGIISSAVLRCTPGDPQEIRSLISDLDSRRREKQPLEYPSAGSAFKRPVGHFAGKLIEDCGLKGTCVGGACVSEKHAGFIVNKGGATARDVLELIGLITERVKAQTGVTLEPEIRFLSE